MMQDYDENIGDAKMMDFIVQVTCAICGTAYPARLSRMWLNLHDACPCCHFENHLSENQSVEAVRLLESLQKQQEMLTVQEPLSHRVTQ